jgi:hypothetical protein
LYLHGEESSDNRRVFASVLVGGGASPLTAGLPRSLVAAVLALIPTIEARETAIS